MATGGGHGVSVTLATLRNGIEIDMSLFKNVTVDADADTLTIGGGNLFGEVIDPLDAVGKEMRGSSRLSNECSLLSLSAATGSCYCVGFAGGSIGGGVGRLQGLHGLVIDNLLSAQVVTAAGDLVTISETENSDLFWGTRGAGVDFSIVLWATYRIYDQTNGGQLLNADMIFPASANREHLEILKSFEANMPAELSFLTDVNWSEEYNGVRRSSPCCGQSY